MRAVVGAGESWARHITGQAFVEEEESDVGYGITLLDCRLNTFG